MKKDLVWTIIGGGNGGQSVAGHLGYKGLKVRVYDIDEETVEIINEQKGIHLVDGVLNGFGAVEFATTNLEKAVHASDVVMVVVPALVHKAIAKDLASVLEDGQIVFIHPGATCGALEFKNVLDEMNCEADIIISEAMSLIYACRSPKKGTASIKGIKNKLMAAALPANKTEEVVKILNIAYPEIYAGKNVLETSLENLNAVMHPGPTLLNTSLIESNRKWKYYYDGITPSIGEYLVALDQERKAIGKAFGFELTDITKWYEVLYDATGSNLSEVVKNNKAYADIDGQKSLQTRYLLEDIPMGLVPLACLGRLAGESIEHIDILIKLGELLLNKDFSKEGRNLENLGLENMCIEEIENYLETGVK